MFASLIESWTSLYANHAALRTVVEFGHIGGLTVGGGCAIAADLATIVAAREGASTRASTLAFLQRTHRIVVLGLVALSASGVLLFAADVETFLPSRIFWLKMGLLALLIMNGALLRLLGLRAIRGDASAWIRLRHTATASLALWLLTTLAGTALPNIG